MLYVLLTHLRPRCALTFPTPVGKQSTLESPHSKDPNKRNIFMKEKGSQHKFEVRYRAICLKSDIEPSFFEDGAMA